MSQPGWDLYRTAVNLSGAQPGAVTPDFLRFLHRIRKDALDGTVGPAGPAGAPGANGPGVAAGGTDGQVLVKASGADYATAWDTLASVANSGAFADLTSHPTTFAGYGITDATAPTYQGYVDPRWYGAAAGIDCSSAFLAAIADANSLGVPVKITGQGVPTVGITRYNCSTSLPIYTNMNIIGDGPDVVQIYFNNNTDGFVCQGAGSSALTSNWSLTGLTIKGMADSSSSATVTAGVRLQYARDFKLDVIVDDFVDGVVFDAGNVGLISGRGRIHVRQSHYPNTVNGFPRYGIYVTGGTKKPQLLTFDTKVYSSLSTLEWDGTVAAGLTLNLDTSSKGPVWAYKGIQVFKYNATSQQYTRSTDYTLYDTTSTPVAVAPGTYNVNSSSLQVAFGGSWSVGDTYRVMFSDSWGKKGIYVSNGTGNTFKGDIGGYEMAIDNQSPNNVFDISYAQLVTDAIFNIGASGGDSYVRSPRQTSNKTISGATLIVDPAATRVLALPTTFTQLRTFNTQTLTTGTLTALAGPGGGVLTFSGYEPTWRDVRVDLDVQLTPGSGSVSVEFAIQTSDDNSTTWTTRVLRDLKVTAATYNGPFIMSWIDTTVLDQVGGVLQQRVYRVAARSITGTDSLTVTSSASHSSSMRITEINPSS